MNIKLIIALFFFFMLGFFVHAFFFPAVFTNNILFYAKQATENKQIPATIENTNKALTEVSYADGEFDPQVVIIGKSYYVGIINQSEKEFMMLTSDNSLLVTPRNYAKSEELRAQLYDPGIYTVSSKMHPTRSLKIIVK